MALPPGDVTAIISGGFALAGGVVGALVNHLASRGKERSERLDQQRTELYETVLSEVFARVDERVRQMVENPIGPATSTPVPHADDAEELRIRARLNMFGSAAVIDAYLDLVRTDQEWQVYNGEYWAMVNSPPLVDSKRQAEQEAELAERDRLRRQWADEATRETWLLISRVREEVDPKGRGAVRLMKPGRRPTLLRRLLGR